MNKARHIADKLALWAKIKRLGQLYGEDSVWVAEYAKDVYNEYIDDLEAAIRCFDDLLKQADILRIGKNAHK